MSFKTRWLADISKFKLKFFLANCNMLHSWEVLDWKLECERERFVPWSVYVSQWANWLSRQYEKLEIWVQIPAKAQIFFSQNYHLYFLPALDSCTNFTVYFSLVKYIKLVSFFDFHLKCFCFCSSVSANFHYNDFLFIYLLTITFKFFILSGLSL